MIDWNNPSLTWLDFDKVINYTSRSELKKKIKTGSAVLSSLEVGKDYDIVAQEGSRTLYRIYTYQASCLIASNDVPPALNSHIPFWAQNERNEWWDAADDNDYAPGAHWCISMKRTIAHWNNYDHHKFYFFTDTSRNDKWAKLAIFNGKTGSAANIDKCSIWDADDNEHYYSDIKWDHPEIYNFLKGLGTIFEGDALAFPTESKDALEEAFGIQVIQSQNSVEIKSNDVVSLDYTYDLTEVDNLEPQEALWMEEVELQLFVDEDVYEVNKEFVDALYKKLAKIRWVAEDVNDNVITLYTADSSHLPELCDVMKKAYDELSKLEPILKEDHCALKEMAEIAFKALHVDEIKADGAKHIIAENEISQLFYVYNNNKGNEHFVVRMLFKDLLRGHKYEDIRIGLRRVFTQNQINLGYEQATDSVKFEIYDTHIDLELKGKKAEFKGFQMMNAVVREYRYADRMLKTGEPPLEIHI